MKYHNEDGQEVEADRTQWAALEAAGWKRGPAAKASESEEGSGDDGAQEGAQAPPRRSRKS